MARSRTYGDQLIRPLTPIFDEKKQLGGQQVGNTPPGLVRPDWLSALPDWFAEAKNYSGSGAWLNQGTSAAGNAALTVPPTFNPASGTTPAHWSFNGSSQYMTIPDNNDFDFTLTEHCSWIMVVASQTVSGILWAQHGTGIAGEYNVQPGSARFGAGTNAVDGTADLSLPAITTTIVTKSGTAISMYQNSLLVDTGTETGTDKASGFDMMIGRRNFATPAFWGGKLFLMWYAKTSAADSAGTLTQAQVSEFQDYVDRGGLFL